MSIPDEDQVEALLESKFKVGDVVRLNSGGPKMTVISVEPPAVSEDGTEYGFTIQAVWFDDSPRKAKLRGEIFPEEILYLCTH